MRAAAGGLFGRPRGARQGAVFSAIESALNDRSIEVRETAIRELGCSGSSSRRPSSTLLRSSSPCWRVGKSLAVRVKAAWAICYFGMDRDRHPPGAGPDVVPALVAALHDPHVDVRRAVAVILGLTTFDPRGRRITAWDRRKDSITPALYAAISDDDKTVQEDAALALFVLGKATSSSSS